MLAARRTFERRSMGQIARGISLVEMLMGVAIVTILIKIAAPPFSDFFSKSRLTSSVATLVADLNYARGESITRNAPVIVCAKVADSADCATTPNWHAGWVVCVDAHADYVCDVASITVPNPIRVRHAVSSCTVITAGTAALRFNPAGAVTGNDAFTIAGGPPASPSRPIRVNSNGYVRTY